LDGLSGEMHGSFLGLIRFAYSLLVDRSTMKQGYPQGWPVEVALYMDVLDFIRFRTCCSDVGPSTVVPIDG
jgi:hypothetical protein